MTKLLLKGLSVSTALFVATSLCAQPILDDFDSYELGALTTQAGAEHWLTWDNDPGGDMETFVVDEEFMSPPHSMRVAEGGVEDVVFLLGADLGTGFYKIAWNMLVPSGKTGYYNHQESQTVAVGWNFDVMFNMNSQSPGTATILIGTNPVHTFPYPEDEWFHLEHFINLDADTMAFLVDGEHVYSMNYNNTIGSINFYSIDANNRYYIDDMEFVEVVFTDIAESSMNEAMVFPNPVSHNLNVQLGEFSGTPTHWTVYDLSGKLMSNNTFNELEIASIDIAHLSTGIYLITLDNGNAQKTMRFVVE